MEAFKQFFIQNAQTLRSGFDVIQESLDRLGKVEKEEIQGEIQIAIEVIEKDPEHLIVQKEDDFKGDSIQEILKISDKTMKFLYKIAYEQFQQRQYEKSGSLFFTLTIINPFVIEFWIGKGLSHFELNNFEQALIDFAMATIVDPLNPWSRIHSAYAYLNLNQLENAQLEFDELAKVPAINQELELEDQIRSLKEALDKTKISKYKVLKEVL